LDAIDPSPTTTITLMMTLLEHTPTASFCPLSHSPYSPSHIPLNASRLGSPTNHFCQAYTTYKDARCIVRIVLVLVLANAQPCLAGIVGNLAASHFSGFGKRVSIEVLNEPTESCTPQVENCLSGPPSK
jgi:hypothetical protein